MAQVLINIDVDDLEGAVRFYTQALGLRVGRRIGAGAVELLGGEAPIYLLQAVGGSVAVPGGEQRRSYQRHWSPVHLDFVVDDLEAAVARAEAAGARRERGIDTQVWGRIAGLADPFGHGLCLIQWRGRGYDEIAAVAPAAGPA